MYTQYIHVYTNPTDMCKISTTPTPTPTSRYGREDHQRHESTRPQRYGNLGRYEFGIWIRRRRYGLGWVWGRYAARSCATAPDNRGRSLWSCRMVWYLDYREVRNVYYVVWYEYLFLRVRFRTSKRRIASQQNIKTWSMVSGNLHIKQLVPYGRKMSFFSIHTFTGRVAEWSLRENVLIWGAIHILRTRTKHPDQVPKQKKCDTAGRGSSYHEDLSVVVSSKRRSGSEVKSELLKN